MRNIVILLALCSGCATERPACSPEALGRLEATYVAEVLTACSAFDTPEACPAYPEIQRRFAQKREEWQACE